MAYSSIGHMGFALVGLAANSQAGVRGVAIYMLIYLAMTLGTFAFILAMRRKDGNVEQIGDLAGLSRTNPVMATILTILMFSLAGIPPLAGFWAKWYVFLAAIDAELYALAVIGVLASVVGAYYYLRIIKIMWFDEPVGGFLPMAGELRVVLGVVGRLRAVLRADRRADRHAGARPPPRPSSDGMAFALGSDALTRTATGSRPHDTIGSTNALALDARAAGDPGSSGSSPAAGKRARPARPRLGDARRQSRGHAAPRRPTATCAWPRRSASSPAWRCAMRWTPWCPDRRIAIGADGGGGAAGDRFELKWPNDVLADGAKLAGILLESALLRASALAVAVGIGVNVVAHPEDLPYPATSLDGARRDGWMPRRFSWRFPTPGRRTCAIWDEGGAWTRSAALA